MRRRGCLVAIGVVVLAPLLFGGGWWCRERWRAGQEEEIYEAVFRHQMQRLEGQLSPPPRHYYLARPDPRERGNPMPAVRDPGPQFMARLRDLGPRVKGWGVVESALGPLDSSVDSVERARRWERLERDPERAGVAIWLTDVVWDHRSAVRVVGA
jgi:hypothetical protein